MQHIETQDPRSISPNPNDGDLYAGLCGGQVAFETYHLGDGVTVAATYAHLMAPFMFAFRRPPHPGSHHPAPWRAGPGGLAFDIEAEIHIPKAFDPTTWFDRFNTAWWILALIRLRTSPRFRVPVVSSVPFSFLSDSGDAHVWPVETASHQLIPVLTPDRPLTASDMDWVAANWRDGADLMASHENFNAAFQALDQSIWSFSPDLALVQIWGGLERLFTTARHRKTYQLTNRISAFLRPSGQIREDLARRILELYDFRSSAAHGSPSEQKGALYDSYAILRECAVAMIESKHVLSESELETIAPV